MKKILFVLMTVIVISGLALTACSAPAAPSQPSPAPAPAPGSEPSGSMPDELVMSTHAIGAITYVVATGWADVISKNSPMGMVVKPQAGPGVYLPQLSSGQIDMAVDLSPGVYRAYRGEGEFEGNRLANLRSLWLNRVQKNGTVAAVREDSDIYGIADLKGKKVASDYGANINIIGYFTVAFAGAGMTWDDVVQVPVPGHVPGLNALQEGRVDATFMMGLGVPAFQEVDSSIGARVIGYPKNPEEIPEFAEWLPGFEGLLLKQSVFPDHLDKDVWGHTQPFWYLTSTNLSEDAAYELVKTAWENADQIAPSHPQMKAFNTDLMPSPKMMAPYHDGAVKFYKEMGVWTDQLEQRQQELLNQ